MAKYSSKIVDAINTIIGTVGEGDETLIISADNAKNIFVTGLVFAKGLM